MKNYLIRFLDRDYGEVEQVVEFRSNGDSNGELEFDAVWGVINAGYQHLDRIIIIEEKKDD